MSQCIGCSRCYHGYVGAGVLIVDNETKQLVLVRDHRTEEYCDFGGSLKAHSTASKTASEELYEESHMGLSIRPEQLEKSPYISISAGEHHKYRCYVIYLDGLKGICRRYYEAKGDIKNKPARFHETDRMTRFPLSGIVRQYREHGEIGTSLKTDKGKTKKISRRLQKILNKWCKSAN